MQNPKPDRDRPVSAREEAAQRQILAMGEILGMRHVRMATDDGDKKPEEPKPAASA